MRLPHFRSLPLLILSLVCLPLSAKADAVGAQSLDQYPSFIEFSSMSPDSTQTILRCGYISDGKTVSLNPNFLEVTQHNAGRGLYTRLQHIDDTIIATTPAPQGSYGLYLQILGGDGALTAATCQTDTATDTILDCHRAPAKTVANDMMLNDRKLGMQCGDVISQGKSKIDPKLANPEKTEEFMAGLRKKIEMLNNAK